MCLFFGGTRGSPKCWLGVLVVAIIVVAIGIVLWFVLDDNKWIARIMVSLGIGMIFSSVVSLSCMMMNQRQGGNGFGGFGNRQFRQNTPGYGYSTNGPYAQPPPMYGVPVQQQQPQSQAMYYV
eukprot:TRINITY_DN21123_c0_g1_i1.p2 TRINITY_DN21123_c0_g1~~TRINITY_DN21123_c0_g1_i1.p2  ORF type:complete len:123 (-),score=14.92 TRINITY_DN21123_c0_g1_i1:282-650(-)